MMIPATAGPVKSGNTPFAWLLLLAGLWCIVLASVDFREVWIYDLSRWAIFGIAAYSGFRFWKEGVRRLSFTLGIMAVIFNPIAPIRFGDAWQIVDGLAGAAFVGAYLWAAGWISKAWKNRNVIGFYALLVGLACFFVVVFTDAYLDSKNGGPERRAAELKAKRESANAAAREKRMKSIFGDDYEEKIYRKIYGEAGHPPANSLPTPEYEPNFHEYWKPIYSEDTNGYDLDWYPGKK